MGRESSWTMGGCFRFTWMTPHFEGSVEVSRRDTDSQLKTDWPLLVSQMTKLIAIAFGEHLTVNELTWSLPSMPPGGSPGEPTPPGNAGP